MKSSAHADWRANPRWEGIHPRSLSTSSPLYGRTMRVEHTIARPGVERLWKLLHEENYGLGLGAVAGTQAIGAKERAAGCSAA